MYFWQKLVYMTHGRLVVQPVVGEDNLYERPSGLPVHPGVSSIRCKRPSHVTGILSPNMMANRLSASFQFWTGRVHLFEARCIAR